MNTLRIANGRVIDPSQSLDEVTDLWIRGGHILALGPQPQLVADRTLDAAGKIVYLQAERAGNANVFPVGSVTKGREGKELSEMGGLVEGGDVAFTDDG